MLTVIIGSQPHRVPEKGAALPRIHQILHGRCERAGGAYRLTILKGVHVAPSLLRLLPRPFLNSSTAHFGAVLIHIKTWQGASARIGGEICKYRRHVLFP